MPLRPEDIKQVIRRYHDRLLSYRDALNELNVYPVPDGDTGTNMTLTVGSMLENLEDAGSMAELADVMALSSLMGARGNSGVILSQILRGLADAFRPEDEVGSDELVQALDMASAAAYEAVQRPVEGTILTVLREAAEAAKEAGPDAGADLAALLQAVYDRAVSALERTPEMLPVLKQAGVVDAGGAGFLLLIAAFLEIVTGADVELPERVLRAQADLVALEATAFDQELASLRYEVMFLLDAPAENLGGFRDRWAILGDSIVVVGGEGTWNCHIHTDHIGPAIEAGVAAGTPYDIKVTDLLEQAGHHGPARFEPRPEVAGAAIAVVAVAVGDGIVEVFRQLGAQGVVTGGQSMNPSTEDLLAVVDSVAAQHVVVLPNNKNIVPVAEQLDALSTKTVAVVPTRSIAQGIAAMVAYNPVDGQLTECMEDMAAAASSVVTGELTHAVRDALVGFGSIAKGDWMGIADGTVVISDPDQETALRGLVAAILPPGAELLTLFVGAGARPSTTKSLVAWLDELHPELEVSEVYGGQPLYPYIVSIE